MPEGVEGEAWAGKRPVLEDGDPSPGPPAARLPPGWAQPDAPQASAPPPGPEAQGWAQGSFLTGDWGGLRTRLGEDGLAPYAIYTTEGFGTLVGGIGTGLDWTSQLEFGLDADAGKLAGLAGGAARQLSLDRGHRPEREPGRQPQPDQ